jgi:hypothetical protein
MCSGLLSSALVCSSCRRHRFGAFASVLVCSRTKCLIVSQVDGGPARVDRPHYSRFSTTTSTTALEPLQRRVDLTVC